MTLVLYRQAEPFVACKYTGVLEELYIMARHLTVGVLFARLFEEVSNENHTPQVVLSAEPSGIVGIKL